MFVLFLGVSWKSFSFPALFCLTKNVLSLSQYALWPVVNLFFFSILTGVVIKIESMRSFCVSYSGQSQQVLTVLWTNHNSKQQRSVTSRYHGIKMSISQQPFLTETAIYIFERWKKSMGYRFVSECNHAQESHTCQFFRSFSAIFAGPRFVDATPWQRDVTTPLYYTWIVTGRKTYVIKL